MHNGDDPLEVPAWIPASPLLMVIGQSPGRREGAVLRPFIGPAGQLARKLVVSLGLDPDHEVLWSNVVSQYKLADPNYRPTAREIGLAGERLQRELQPTVQAIVLLGDVASRLAFKGTMAQMSGRSTILYGLPCFATYHPAAVLRATDRVKKASIEGEIRGTLAQAVSVVKGEKWEVEIPEWKEIDLVEICR